VLAGQRLNGGGDGDERECIEPHEREYVRPRPQQVAFSIIEHEEHE
jgi:hypothetical protein